MDTTSHRTATIAVLNSLCELDNDIGWAVVNTHGFEDFPPEVQAWKSRFKKESTLYPRVILARFALAMPIAGTKWDFNERAGDDDG